MAQTTTQKMRYPIIATLAAFGLVTFLYLIGAFTTIEASLTDRFFTVSEPRSEIIIIDIDEASLATLGQWPFPRSLHAELLHHLTGARTVGFDVIFSEPSQYGEDDDLQFAAALEAFPNAVVLPQVVNEQSGRLIDPLPQFKEHAQVGFVNTMPDRDGVVRRVSLTRSAGNNLDRVILDTYSNPPDTPDAFVINYVGSAKTFTTLSYVDVVEGRIPAGVFSDKTVLVGAGAAGLGDTFQTPFGAMAGVEIRANTLHSALQENWLTPVPMWFGIGLLLFVAVLAYIFITRIESWLYLSLIEVVLFVGIIVDAYFAFSLGYLFPHVYELVLFVLLSGILLFLKYIFEQQEKAFIRRGFSQYVASEVVEELASHPEKLTLGGETKTLSILFSDIRGFTTISEQLTPQELMTQLNEYLEEMSEAVMNRKGLVDKYIGDAVMAFWGAPLSNKNHAINACESALDMMKALRKINERWKEEGRPPFAIGVGISTGDVVVGNMGSRRRFNYSIIGDEVNFSARIEGLTKQYGVECLIGESTYELIKDVGHLHTRELDDVMVKGKVEPRRIYQLMTKEVDDDTREMLAHFARGRQAYLKGNFSDAVSAFKEALAIDENDGPSKVFLERSEELVTEPPSDWNGVFEFKTK